MFQTTFYRFEPVTIDDMEEIRNRDGLGFVIKTDTTEEVQKYIDWLSSLTPYEDHMATYIIITGEILNKYYSTIWNYEKLYPNNMILLGFYLDEMEDRDAVIDALELDDLLWLEDIIRGFYINEVIDKWRKINDL